MCDNEGWLCLGVAKVESLDRKITGKRCPVFDYMEKQIFTIDGYKKEIFKEFSRLINTTLS